MKDDELIKLLHKNPEKGIKKLSEQYAGLVYTVVKGKLCDFSVAEIEECISDTFSEFYLDLDSYKPNSGSIKSWLCVMARNNAIDILRKSQRQPVIVSIDDENIYKQYTEGFSVEEDFENSDLLSNILEEIKKLGEPDCEIIVRKFYFNEPSKEIAKALDISVSNVDTRAHRAIAKLRKIFGGDFV